VSRLIGTARHRDIGRTASPGRRLFQEESRYYKSLGCCEAEKILHRLAPAAPPARLICAPAIGSPDPDFVTAPESFPMERTVPVAVRSRFPVEARAIAPTMKER
jgi:hypothetical protein